MHIVAFWSLPYIQYESVVTCGQFHGDMKAWLVLTRFLTLSLMIPVKYVIWHLGLNEWVKEERFRVFFFPHAYSAFLKISVLFV